MAVKKINEKDFEKEVTNEKGVVVVDFNADWCGPCRMLAPVLDELSREQRGVKFVAVNVDENPIISEKFGIFSIPCVVFMKDGKEISRSLGFVPKSELEDILKGL